MVISHCSHDWTRLRSGAYQFKMEMNQPNTNTVLSKKNEGPGMENQTKSGTGTNITDEANSNNRVLTMQNLLPEVLELIFKRVETPKDLVSCWNTTPSWGKILRLNDFYFKMTLPFMMPLLSRKDLIACSKVSKLWNAAVDACIQDILPEDFDTDWKPDVKKFQMGLTLLAMNMSDFTNAITRITPHGSRKLIPVVNPMIFRRVHFIIWLYEDMELTAEQPNPPRNSYTFESKCFLMCLDHHGHLIRQLHIHFAGDNVGYLEKIKLIHSGLKRTPNLRVLKISMSTYRVAGQNSEDKVAAFHDYISQNPWPSLKHLKVLTFQKCVTHKEFAGMLNAYGPTLIFLQFGFPLMEPKQLIPGRFSCLQKFYWYYNKIWTGMHLGAFMQSNNCPLKELNVSVGVVPDEENYVGLTVAANAASATLETLEMCYGGECPARFNMDITKFERMQLPKLKVLTLNNVCYPSLDFLKKVCPALEALTVTPHFWREEDEVEYGNMEHGEMYANLYAQYRFWKELALIQSVDVTFLEYSQIQGETEGERTREKTRKVFTRYEYEARKRTYVK